MLRTFRLLASVKPAPSRFLEPGAPTGLTGLRTHSSPRSTLVFLYRSTLDKLQALPAHSAYRQSAEAVTRQRLAVVEAAKPEGYDAWLAQATRLLEAHPELFAVERTAAVDGAAAWRAERGGSTFLVRTEPARRDQRDVEWDGEIDEGPELEGVRTEEERAYQTISAARRPLEAAEPAEWVDEPQLTADQYVPSCRARRLAVFRWLLTCFRRISDIEHKIGAGLIEEVIQVAEGEDKLVDVMLKAKVYDSPPRRPRPIQDTDACLQLGELGREAG